jgi:hypothetical protein
MEGDVETFKILTAANLKGLDPDAHNSKGWTARQHFNARVCISDDLEAAFNALVESIRRNNAEAEKDMIVELDEDSDEKEFFDALESYDG